MRSKTGGHRTVGPGSRRRRFGAWCGIAVLLGHLLITLGQIVPTAAASEADPTAPAFLVTCVVYGNPNGEADRQDKGQDPLDRSSCPVCQSEMLCQSLLPVAAVTAPVPWTATVVPTVPAPLIPTHGHDPVRRFARGPPSFA